MTNSHSERVIKVGDELWQPIRPPKRGDDRTAFHAQLLMPGFSLAFHAASLGRSRSTIATYRADANRAAQYNPAVMAAVKEAIYEMRPEHALQMARVRGKAQLPYWSRLAMFEYRKRGYSRRQIADAFRCSPSTVANVLQGKGSAYGALSGKRRLTEAQRRPHNRWERGKRRAEGLDTMSI